MKTTLYAAVIAAALLPCAAHAVKSDRDQPVQIEADKVTIDDRNKVHVFEGSVVLIQGSLEIRGDKMVVTQGADGFQSGVATGSAKKPATFRQRREGTDTFIDGEAERIEYDTRAERARLFTRARVSSAGDIVTGDFIEYDAITERYSASTAAGQKGEGRVRAVIQPRSGGEDAKP